MNTFDVTVPSNELASLLSRAQGVVDPRSPIPMLACVLLRAKGSQLSIAASDLYIGVTSTMTAEVREPGAIALPMRELAERVKAMPSGPVNLKADDKMSVVLKSKVGNRRYVLKGAPAAEYPPIPSPGEDAPSVSLATKTLSSLLGRSHFAMMGDEVDGASPQKTSLFVEWDGEVIRAFSTDGHRMVRLQLQTPDRRGSLRMMLSGKSVRELRRHCEDAFAKFDDVSLVTNGHSAFFSVDGFTANAQLVSADPLPFKNVLDSIPAPKTTARVAKKAIVDALRGISFVHQEGSVELKLGDGAIRIASKSDKGGEGDDQVPAEVEGDRASIWSSAKYLVESIGAVDGDELTIGIVGEIDPIRVVPVDKADDYLGIVMPRREK